MSYITSRVYPDASTYQGPAGKIEFQATVSKIIGLTTLDAANEFLNKAQAEIYAQGLLPLSVHLYKISEDLFNETWTGVAYARPPPGMATQATELAILLGKAFLYAAAAILLFTLYLNITATTDLVYGPGGSGGGILQLAVLLIGGSLLVTALTRFKWGGATR